MSLPPPPPARPPPPPPKKSAAKALSPEEQKMRDEMMAQTVGATPAAAPAPAAAAPAPAAAAPAQSGLPPPPPARPPPPPPKKSAAKALSPEEQKMRDEMMAQTVGGAAAAPAPAAAAPAAAGAPPPPPKAPPPPPPPTKAAPPPAKAPPPPPPPTKTAPPPPPTKAPPPPPAAPSPPSGAPAPPPKKAPPPPPPTKSSAPTGTFEKPALRSTKPAEAPAKEAPKPAEAPKADEPKKEEKPAEKPEEKEKPAEPKTEEKPAEPAAAAPAAALPAGLLEALQNGMNQAARAQVEATESAARGTIATDGLTEAAALQSRCASQLALLASKIEARRVAFSQRGDQLWSDRCAAGADTAADEASARAGIAMAASASRSRIAESLLGAAREAAFCAEERASQLSKEVEKQNDALRTLQALLTSPDGPILGGGNGGGGGGPLAASSLLSRLLELQQEERRGRLFIEDSELSLRRMVSQMCGEVFVSPFRRLRGEFGTTDGGSPLPLQRAETEPVSATRGAARQLSLEPVPEPQTAVSAQPTPKVDAPDLVDPAEAAARRAVMESRAIHGASWLHEYFATRAMVPRNEAADVATTLAKHGFGSGLGSNVPLPHVASAVDRAGAFAALQRSLDGLTDADLISMGVTLVGERRALLGAIAAAAVESKPHDTQAAPSSIHSPPPGLRLQQQSSNEGSVGNESTPETPLTPASPARTMAPPPSPSTPAVGSKPQVLSPPVVVPFAAASSPTQQEPRQAVAAAPAASVHDLDAILSERRKESHREDHHLQQQWAVLRTANPTSSVVGSYSSRIGSASGSGTEEDLWGAQWRRAGIDDIRTETQWERHVEELRDRVIGGMTVALSEVPQPPLAGTGARAKLLHLRQRGSPCPRTITTSTPGSPVGSPYQQRQPSTGSLSGSPSGGRLGGSGRWW